VPETKRPTLSVILPNYNHGHLVGRAVAALLAQEWLPDEIIIVDDASTDDSLDRLEAIRSSSPLVRVLRNDANRGVVQALNRGIEASRGTHLYLAAADDWVLPGFFATALALLERHPQAALVCGEANLISGETGRPMGRRPFVRPSSHTAYLPPQAVSALIESSDNWILTGAAIVVREQLLAAGGLKPDLGSFADGYLLRKLALLHGFCFMPRPPVATWQVFADGVSRQTASDPAKAQRVLQAALAHFVADAAFPRRYSVLFSRRWNFALARLAVMAEPMNEAVLLRSGVRNRIDKIAITALCRLPIVTLRRLFLLTWLWLRFWPMKLTALLHTYLSRRMERMAGVAGFTGDE